MNRRVREREQTGGISADLYGGGGGDKSGIGKSRRSGTPPPCECEGKEGRHFPRLRIPCPDPLTWESFFLPSG